jgi:hypothetical protein
VKASNLTDMSIKSINRNSAFSLPIDTYINSTRNVLGPNKLMLAEDKGGISLSFIFTLTEMHSPNIG